MIFRISDRSRAKLIQFRVSVVGRADLLPGYVLNSPITIWRRRTRPLRVIALRQADQARTNFAAIESVFEVIQKQLGATADAPGASQDALRIIFATMMLTTLSLLFFLR